MPSLIRTLRSVQRVGLREWWRQMQYIGDAKSGTFVGKDQCVLRVSQLLTCFMISARFGNRYFENVNPQEEVPGEFCWHIFGFPSYERTYTTAVL